MSNTDKVRNNIKNKFVKNMENLYTHILAIIKMLKLLTNAQKNIKKIVKLVLSGLSTAGFC